MSKFLKRIDFVTSGLIYSIRQMFSSTVNTVMERKAHKEHGTSSQQNHVSFQVFHMTLNRLLSRSLASYF